MDNDPIDPKTYAAMANAIFHAQTYLNTVEKHCDQLEAGEEVTVDVGAAYEQWMTAHRFALELLTSE